MRSVADEVHQLGLRFGLYTALAAQTCGGPGMAGAGSCGYEVLDALQYANWTIDYVKDGDARFTASCSFFCVRVHCVCCVSTSAGRRASRLLVQTAAAAATAQHRIRRWPATPRSKAASLVLASAPSLSLCLPPRCPHSVLRCVFAPCPPRSTTAHLFPVISPPFLLHPCVPLLLKSFSAGCGWSESGRPIYLTTEASPNLTRHAERPDLYGNSHRTGHDSQPSYASVMSQVRVCCCILLFGVSRLATRHPPCYRHPPCHPPPFLFVGPQPPASTPARGGRWTSLQTLGRWCITTLGTAGITMTWT